MKVILHIVGSMNRAGAETMLMNLFRNIDKSSFKFEFLYFNEKESDYDVEILELGGKIHKLNISKNPFTNFIKFYKFLRKNNYDVIHSHILFSSYLYVLVGYILGVKKRISHSHNSSDVNSGNFYGRLYQYCARFIINNFSTDFIACGVLASNFLFYKNKNVLIINNAIDVNKYIEISYNSKDYINNNFNIGESTLKIIQVGRLSDVKNHKFSIQLAEYLKSKKLDFNLQIIGQGENYKAINQQIRKLSLDKEVQLLGVRDDIPQLMASSDFMIMPSIHEGFPVVLVESQACSLKSLISTNISREVDLGLGLVTFLDLGRTNFDQWYQELKKKKNKEIKVKKIMIEKGFDINSSVASLQSFYEK